LRKGFKMTVVGANKLLVVVFELLEAYHFVVFWVVLVNVVLKFFL
jgi:hypothetical protein